MAQDQDLLKGVNLFLSSNTQTGSDARVINWNTCRASGNAASIPGTPDIYSEEFPRNFEIKDQLDKGSFGTVYLVGDLDKTDEKRFVAKQIWIKAKQDTIDLLFAETNILLNAKHENIVQMHGYQIKDMSIFIFMEFMQKGTLSKYIKDKNGLSELKTCLFTKQILEGLLYLHSKNILHLDIKGNNILLEDEDKVKLSDFGLSKIIKMGQDLSSISGGTSRYMAPEVITSELENEYFSRADIWSVGCTVVEMITMKSPSASVESQCVLFRVGTKKKPVLKLPEHTSKELREFLDKCFTVDFKERPSAEELLQTDSFLLA
ncbi:mitogen-activated protein kinase kinase kinase 2-like [Physella acuta]|uniref:mitogen-activated protein kinase kinase kinase 2-like n=1 Tax=Physella acuta TaxID=109671 RepID=UPI0027DD97E1|nr:mitogen-activated protein kinase kinase kinase 2-like [Physella acuta]